MTNHRLLGTNVTCFCTECQAAACIHVVEALDEAETHAAQQKARFAAMAALLEPTKEANS